VNINVIAKKLASVERAFLKDLMIPKRR
jgi:hypothetical protein